MAWVGPLFGIGDGRGIFSTEESILILENEILENHQNQGKGISLREATDVRIAHNRIQKNYVGISIVESHRVRIANNVVMENDATGISDLTSAGVFIEDNRVERQGGRGIELDCSVCNIERNQVTNNAGRGLILSHARVEALRER